MRPRTTSGFGAALRMLQLPALGRTLQEKGFEILRQAQPSLRLPSICLTSPYVTGSSKHSPYGFTYCIWSKTGGGEGLGMRLVRVVCACVSHHSTTMRSEGACMYACVCYRAYHKEWGCMCCLCVLPCLPQWAARVYVYVTMPTIVRSEGACMCLCVLPCLPQWAARVQSTIFYLRSPRTKRYCPPPTEQQPYNLLSIAWILDGSVGRQHMAMRIQPYYHTIASFPGHMGMGL